MNLSHKYRVLYAMTDGVRIATDKLPKLWRHTNCLFFRHVPKLGQLDEKQQKRAICNAKRDGLIKSPGQAAPNWIAMTEKGISAYNVIWNEIEENAQKEFLKKQIKGLAADTHPALSGI